MLPSGCALLHGERKRKLHKIVDEIAPSEAPNKKKIRHAIKRTGKPLKIFNFILYIFPLF